VRFTLKTLFAAISVSALICCIFFALPGWLSAIVLGTLWFLAPPLLIAGIVYGRGYGRAFSIGCVSAGGCLPFVYLYYVYALAMTLVDGDWFTEIDNDAILAIKIAFAVATVLIGLSGLSAMSVRWMSLRLNRKADKHRASPPKEYSLLHGRVSTIQMESTPVEPEPRSNAPPP